MIENKKRTKYSGRSEDILCGAAAGISYQESGRGSLDDFLDRELPHELRGGVGDLLFAYYRHRRSIDRAIVKNTQKAPQIELRQILAAAITQIKYQTGIVPESAVNVAVDFVKYRQGRGAGNFVNAVLRTIMRSLDTVKDLPGKIFPDEYYRMLKRNELQNEAKRLEELFLGRSELTFRQCRDILSEELAELGAVELDELDFIPADWKFYRCGEPAKLFSGDYLTRGRIYIQDPATALAPGLAELSGSETVLDLCAAPGGKSLLLFSRLNGRGKLIAGDISERRLELVRDNFARHQVAAEVRVMDGRELPFEAASLDLILVDAPCSNLGVFRKRPDVPSNYQPEKQAELIEIQRRILISAADKVKVGGAIIYSTCTIDRLENDDNVAWFLENHPEYELATKKLLLPKEYHDGAFAAKLRRVR
ncbi:MAG: methyltransferase domain-containing protein [Lentisphaeria bacterium]|nr:methyltransferase domain-containing protein [Lentisphaeria bacterium]